MSTVLDQLLDAAIAARNAGELDEAKALCMRALEQADESDRRSRAIVYGELGYVYRLQENHEQSAECYRRSVVLAPRAELPSLGLFHALARRQRWLEAMEEAVRFLRGSDSDEYRELFCDGFGDEMDTSIRALVDETRRLLRMRRSAS